MHDKAPCMRALAVQKLLHDNKINFWANNAWPGNSPDLNPAEHIWATIKDGVERLMHTGNLPNRLAKDTLKKAILTVLKGLENDQNLFRKLFYHIQAD